MKDHELRELINDVTAVARIYAHTQQLREQISHLIAPVFSELQRENAEHLPVINMLILCGEEPCRTIESYPGKLRALIDAYITIKRQNEGLNRQLDFEVKQRIELRKKLAAALARNEEK